MSKKIIWSILAVFLLLFLLSACGGEGDGTTIPIGGTTEAPDAVTTGAPTASVGDGTTAPEGITTEPPAVLGTTDSEVFTTWEDSPLIPGEQTPSVVDYRWEKINGTQYLVFDDISLYDFYNNHFANSIFDNLQKFYDTVTKNELLLQDKIIAATAFYQDEIGIEVVDVHDLRIPGGDLIEIREDALVYWYGDYYSILCYRGEEDWYFDYYAKNAYERYLERFTGFLANKGVTEIGREEERNATVYQDSRYYYVEYTVEGKNCTLLVREEYHKNDLEAIPYHVTIVSADPEERFAFEDYRPEERPTLEWIASLHAAPFVPETE